MTWHDGNRGLIRELREAIEQRFAPEQTAALEDFAERFFRNLAAEDLAGRDLSDLVGAIAGFWFFIQRFSGENAKVRVFNPEYARHGWQLGHTVVAALCQDMPFALESVRAELNRRNLVIHVVHSIPFRVIRGEDHRLQLLVADTAEPVAGIATEALLYFEINRTSDMGEIKELRQALEDILAEVRVVTDDFDAMQESLGRATADLARMPVDAELRAEYEAFLRWMRHGHFTFLGYEFLRVRRSPQGIAIERDEQSHQGLLRLRSSFGQYDLYRDLSRAERPPLLYFAKSSVRSRVHRRVYPDYVEIRLFDEDKLVGVHRLLGLYTSRAYSESTGDIPVVRRKVAAVMRRSQLPPRSHEGSALARVLEVYPRDELFQSSEDELFTIAMGINQIQERRLVRLFMRCDERNKFVSCLVFMPRELYQTELRQRIQSLLCDAFDAEEAEFTTFFSESILTRTHFVLRTDLGRIQPVNAGELEIQVAELTMSWEDHLRRHLLEEFGEERGTILANAYRGAFPAGYRDDCEPRAALHDIRKMAGLAGSRDIAMSVYRTLTDPANALRFRLYHLDSPLILSDILPILENLGLLVEGERPYDIRRRDGKTVWIHEFSMRFPSRDTVDVAAVADLFQEAFAHVWEMKAENDRFNQLVLGASLPWHQVALLRAYSRYLKQIQFPFSSEYIADTLSRHVEISRRLVELFAVSFDPGFTGSTRERRETARDVAQQIEQALDEVPNLTEDRIFRMYLRLIRATLRCNYYRRSNSDIMPYFSFKLRPALIPDIPLPCPEFEIFVYSPRVEGVHLRGGRVARGGLRWSDRPEDYRTEILGLVKAQQVKNAVIVPTGAKGGFVPRLLPIDADRNQRDEEGRACYQLFIRGLLDITDNLQGEHVEPPPEVVCWDDADSYLVVAADKGTATFSDLANEVAAEYGFWLGDAFASGGRYGYDHKKMGITARGTWISVQRHFREMGVDVQSETITVVGIGDMSGDVFGNGMLSSRHIKLVAAFNHQHIFLDPDPDPEASYRERERLFILPRSSWEDYDAGLISAGGGIYSRDAKSIPLSVQVRDRLGIEAEQLSPSALIYHLLQSPVDLLWNGGIGTYVKASVESHADAGDKTNDALRVNARQLRCKVVGEGGNLGMTQSARVEYSLAGGRCNTDFIDNSGGVDCSDHEVNLKILLNRMVAEGDLTEKQRRQLLETLTDDVAELVLANNRRQTLALSLAEQDTVERIGEYRRLLNQLETDELIRRDLDFLPEDETLLERRARVEGLVRPELAQLLCTVKSQLKTALVSASLVDDAYLLSALYSAFPKPISQRFEDELAGHRLRREIIATQTANALVNDMGITFLERMKQSTGADTGTVAAAYVAARDLFELPRHWAAVSELEGQVDSTVLYSMLATLIRLVRRGARWLIRNRRVRLEPQREVLRFRDSLRQLASELPQLLPELPAMDYRQRREQLLSDGVPKTLAHQVALATALYPGLGIIDAAEELQQSPLRVAEAFFGVAAELELDWFARCIADLKVENQWQALAREAYRDDLEWQLRTLTAAVLHHCKGDGDIQVGLAGWLGQQRSLVERWRNMLIDLHAAETPDFSMHSVAIRELLDLAQSSRFDAKEG